MFFFEREKLSLLAEDLAEQFKNSEPFPHVVIDNLLPEDVALKIAEQFPGPDESGWNFVGPGDSVHSNSKKEKLARSDEQSFPDDIRHLIYCLQSGVFLEFLQKVTGIEHLAPDPSHLGGGLHSTGQGGRLMVHVDASRHPNRDFQQMCNMIYYCTPDWEDEWGGHIELWDKDGKKCVTKAAPKFNRAVLFHTNKDSLHGQPIPMTCPENVRRNSIAMYYYSTNRDQSDLHYTNYVQWKHVTEHDKKAPVHVVKDIIRKTLPAEVTNKISNVVRKVTK